MSQLGNKWENLGKVSKIMGRLEHPNIYRTSSLEQSTGHFAQRATTVIACKYLIMQLHCNHYAQAGTFNVII